MRSLRNTLLEIRLYLLLGILRAPLLLLPPSLARSNNGLDRVPKTFDGLQWAGSSWKRTHSTHTPLAACVPVEREGSKERRKIYMPYIIYIHIDHSLSLSLSQVARAAQSLQLNDLNNVLAVLRFTPVWVRVCYKYTWRVYIYIYSHIQPWFACDPIAYTHTI